MALKVWTNNEFKGFYPVGSTAVIVAETPKEAAYFLRLALKKIGLGERVSADDMKEIEIIGGQVTILNDGEY